MYVTTIAISGPSNEEGKMGKAARGVDNIALSSFVYVFFFFFFALLSFFTLSLLFYFF